MKKIYHKSVKTKFKTIFARCVLVLLMCMFCFSCTVGCSIFDGLKSSPNYGNNNEVGSSDVPPTHPDHLPPPSDGDDDEDQDPDNMTEEEKDEATDGVSVDYVKVLRKPLSYDFTNNVTENEGSKDYYGHFSGNILTWFFQMYGNFNTGYDQVTNILALNNFDLFYQITQNEKMNQLSADFQLNKDNYLYWYDAIRYRISDVQPVYQDATTDCICPPKTPICICGHKAKGALVSRKPITASQEELALNDRSHSAKLRIFEKF